VKSLVRFTLSDRRPASMSGVTILQPGEVWRSPAAWAVAAVVQNTSRVPLFVTFNDSPSMRNDGRQFDLAPELTTEKPLR
jgi:hypothetical protein